MRAAPAARCSLVLVLLASAASAATLDYAWETAVNPGMNASFAGPIPYRQVLSATGLTAGVTSFHVFIGYGAPYAPAWDFRGGGFTPGVNCQQHEAFTWTTAPAGCASIPGLTLYVSISGQITDPTRAFLEILGEFPAGFAPDPATRYGLAELIYDLKDAVVGDGGATKCGYAEWPLCFAVQFAELTPAPQPMAVGNGFLEWQDPTNRIGCPAVTPARPRTWGALKLLYR